MSDKSSGDMLGIDQDQRSMTLNVGHTAELRREGHQTHTYLQANIVRAR
jgi:hypothetical protein